MDRVVIIGAGGFGREVLDILEACNAAGAAYEPVGFIVDPQYGAPGTRVNDLPILGGFDWLEEHAREVSVTCGVGASHHRYQLVRRAAALDCRFFNLIHPSVLLTPRVRMGQGVVIAAGCILTNRITVGSHVHIDLACTISHDAVLGDYVTVSPGVHVTGNITLGEGCYVGTGVNFVEKHTIGEWSILGAGSVITADVPANTTVVGVPGRVIKTRAPGWHLGQPPSGLRESASA